jgi:hypothetical protein
MTFIIPPITSLPAPQPSSAAQGLTQQNQVLQATQAAAAASAVQTRSAAVASGNSAGSEKAKKERGRNSDREADSTEAKTDAGGVHPRPRGMGNKADVTV